MVKGFVKNTTVNDGVAHQRRVGQYLSIAYQDSISH